MAFIHSKNIYNNVNVPPVILMIIALHCLFFPFAALAADAGYIVAEPFTEERRLDLNSADEFDFMDIYELDMLAAEKAVGFRRENGPFTKEEDLLNFIPQDAFLDIFETVEVGSLKSPQLNLFNGNSFTDYFYDIDKKESLSSYSRYNLNFGDTMDLRLAFGQTSGENHLYIKEKFVNIYYYSDSYLKKGYVIESSPAKQKIKIARETDEEIRKKDIEFLDGYFSEKVMLGRRKRKKINGLYETNLESYKKYILVKKKKKTDEEPLQEDNAAQADAGAAEKKDGGEELVKSVKLDMPSYDAPAKTSEVSVSGGAEKPKVLSMVLTLGDVMLPQGRHPLINLHRNNNSGLKFKKYFQNFDFSLIGTKLADKNQQRIGSGLNFSLSENSRIGGRVEKIWDNNYNHNIDYVHLYGMGRVENTSVYGEFQNVFNGAESIFAEAMSGFRDVNLTTRILSVKENYTDPLVVAPYSFDGQFSTFLRMNYNISGRASFATSYNVSELKKNDPDEDYGTQKITKYRFLLYPNQKSRIMLTYVDERTPLDILNNTFMTSLRYAYKPKISIIGKFAIKDEDVSSPAGRTSESSVEWQRRVSNNLKLIFKYINVWDENKLNTSDEFTNIIKCAYYRNF